MSIHISVLHKPRPPAAAYIYHVDVEVDYIHKGVGAYVLQVPHTVVPIPKSYHGSGGWKLASKFLHNKLSI